MEAPSRKDRGQRTSEGEVLGKAARGKWARSGGSKYESRSSPSITGMMVVTLGPGTTMVVFLPGMMVVVLGPRTMVVVSDPWMTVLVPGR